MANSLPELSICIPTFQREESIFSIVSDLLRSERYDFEIVVIDNHSTDNTFLRLHGLSDSRLRVVRNQTNIGGWLNVVRSVNYGNGRVKIFMTDKDICHPQSLAAFIDFLKNHPDIGCGYCEFTDEFKQATRIFNAGVDSVRAVGYSWRHPTGYFFSKTLLDRSDYIQAYRDSESIGQFPFDLLLAEFAVTSPAAIYTKGLFTREDSSAAAKTKSFITSGNCSDAFFRPENRLKVALNFSKHLRSLKLPHWDKRAIEASIFLHGMTSSTNGYRKLLANEELCSHYHMQSRVVGMKELLVIAFTYSKNYFKLSDDSFVPRCTRFFVICVFSIPVLIKKIVRRL